VIQYVDCSPNVLVLMTKNAMIIFATFKDMQNKKKRRS